MKATRITVLPIAATLMLGACNRSEEPAPAEPTEKSDPATGGEEASASSKALREAYHRTVVATGTNLTRKEAEAQILAINPKIFSPDNVPHNLDAAIDARHSSLKVLLAGRPLPQFTSLLLEKREHSQLELAEKILLARALEDISRFVAQNN